MAKINGTACLVFKDGTKIDNMKGSTLNLNKDLPDCTTKDSTDAFKEHLIDGEKDWSIDFDGLGDLVAATGNVKDLVDIILSDEQPVIMFSTEVNADWFCYGSCSLKNIKIDAKKNEAIAISGSFIGNGVLTTGTVSGS